MQERQAETVQPAHYWPDLDEARGLRGLLHRLPVASRIRWLRLCCMKVSQGMKMKVDVVEQTGDVRSVLADFWSIVGQNGLSLEWATGLAEYMVRGKDIREKLHSSATRPSI